MTEYNEATAMQGVAERFAKAAEELRLTGRQLFRDCCKRPGFKQNQERLAEAHQKGHRTVLSEIWRKCGVDVHGRGQPIPGS